MFRSSIILTATLLGGTLPAVALGAPAADGAPPPTAVSNVSTVKPGETLSDLLERSERTFRAAENHTAIPERAELFLESEALAARAVEMDPQCAEAHFRLFAAKGSRLLDQGPMKSMFELPSLDEHLNKAIELEPDHAHALAAKGGVLFDLPRFLGRDIAGARTYLERALKLNAKGPATRVTMARLLLHEGDRDGARRQALMAGHYACVTRRVKPLKDALALLAELDG